MSIEQPEYLSESIKENDPVFPWDHLEKEEDGFWKNFMAWERWMAEIFDSLLDSAYPEQTMKMYQTMIELVTHEHSKRGRHENSETFNLPDTSCNSDGVFSVLAQKGPRQSA